LGRALAACRAPPHAKNAQVPSTPRRSVVIAALALLIAISLPRYVDGVRSGDYARAAQMVALVWIGFFVSGRYWVKGNARFSRDLVMAAALICLPPLLYHLYDGRRFSDRSGNLMLLAGIASYSYGVLIRGKPGFQRSH
jgi:hypothetical protein